MTTFTPSEFFPLLSAIEGCNPDQIRAVFDPIADTSFVCPDTYDRAVARLSRLKVTTPDERDPFDIETDAMFDALCLS